MPSLLISAESILRYFSDHNKNLLMLHIHT